jgi:hypothetical protein
MPQVEAAACGIPIATVEYSAMVDIISKLEAYPIKIKTYFKELETKAIRVYPDNDCLIDIILKELDKPISIRNNNRIRIRNLTEKYYNWDNIAKIWENYFDNLDFRSDWSKPLPILRKASISNKDSNFSQFINLCNNTMKNSELLSSFKFLNMLQNADYGFHYVSPTQISAYGINNLCDHINTMIDNNNRSEEVRQKNIKFEEDFIQYAHLKNDI